MLIDKYIENALYLYQCVIVPGFGGFVAVEAPEEPEHEQGKFAPGKKHFTFNPLLKVNDGVLAMYIANMRDITYSEAMTEITHAVDFYLSILEKGDTLDIEGVGSIVPGENKPTFIPYGTKDFCREQYGLTSTRIVADQTPEPQQTARHTTAAHTAVQAAVQAANAAPAASDIAAQDSPSADQAINAVLMEAAEKATIDKFHGDTSAHASTSCPTDKEPDGGQAVEHSDNALADEDPAEEPDQTRNTEAPLPDSEEQAENQEDTPSPRTDSDDTPQQDGTHSDPRPRKAIRIVVAAIVVAAALAGLFFFVFRSGANLYFRKDSQTQKTTTASVPDTAKIALAEIRNDSTGKTASDLAGAYPADTTGKTATTGLPSDSLDTGYVPDKPFYVIATAVESKQNATRTLEKLRAEGYPAEYAGYQNGLYLIAYRGFYSRTQAFGLRDELEKTTNGDVWVKVYNRNADKKTD